ncbi:MAG: hypothetical protein RL594_972 [Bacteroidota bacterium]
MNAEHDRIGVGILGSGAGSNARAIIQRSRETSASYTVLAVYSTKAEAGILDVARSMGVDAVALPNEDWERALSSDVTHRGIRVLALAGFMRKLPDSIIRQLSGHVVNIHPSLLPSYGGQGMYGIHVHRAVIAAGEARSGATVHRVTTGYDEGAIIEQSSLRILTDETPESLQERVKLVEHSLYPVAIDTYCRTL